MTNASITLGCNGCMKFCKESFGKEYDEYNILLSGKIFTFAHVSKMFCGENKEIKKEAELQHGIQLFL